MATARRKEFCPSYFAGLVGPTRARYEEKVTMCDGVDPYTLCAGTDTAADVELLPVTTHADIVNYLVLSTNYVSLAEMKAYKALEAHNYFTSGRVSGMTAMRLPSKRVIVLSEVRLNFKIISLRAAGYNRVNTVPTCVNPSVHCA